MSCKPCPTKMWRAQQPRILPLYLSAHFLLEQFLLLSSSDDLSSFKGIFSLKTHIMNKIQEQGWPQPLKKMHENRAQRETNKKVLKEGFTSWVFREPSRVRVRNTVSNANKWQDSWIFHNQRQSIPRLTIWIQDYISTRNRWPSLSTSSKTTNTQISIING